MRDQSAPCFAHETLTSRGMLGAAAGKDPWRLSAVPGTKWHIVRLVFVPPSRTRCSYSLQTTCRYCIDLIFFIASPYRMLQSLVHPAIASTIHISRVAFISVCRSPDNTASASCATAATHYSGVESVEGLPCGSNSSEPNLIPLLARLCIPDLEDKLDLQRRNCSCVEA
jgi:hypothetical protein